VREGCNLRAARSRHRSAGRQAGCNRPADLRRRIAAEEAAEAEAAEAEAAEAEAEAAEAEAAEAEAEAAEAEAAEAEAEAGTPCTPPA
jgi:hypothetical protein